MIPHLKTYVTLGALCSIKTQLPGDRVAGRELLVAQLEASRAAQVVHQQRTRGPQLPDAAGAVSQPEGPLHVRPANALQAAQDPLPSGELDMHFRHHSRYISKWTSSIGLTHLNQMTTESNEVCIYVPQFRSLDPGPRGHQVHCASLLPVLRVERALSARVGSPREGLALEGHQW